MLTENINTMIDNSPAADVGSSDAQSLSQEFLTHSAKSAATTLEMAKIVCRAKTLGGKGFEQFCALIGYKPESSSIRKLRCIGAKADVLERFLAILPSSWTTLYDLSQLAERDLEELLEGGRVKPSSTAAELSVLVGKPTSAKSAPDATNDDDRSVPNGTEENEVRFFVPLTLSAEQLSRLREFRDWLRSEQIEVQIGLALDQRLAFVHASSCNCPACSGSRIGN